METARPNLFVRAMPSLTDLAFLMPIVFLFARLDGAKMMLGDGDTGWHVRTGEWILANGRVPDRDIFSFTKAGEPWFAWEWLWDVVSGWLHQHWGMGAVVLGSIFVLSITFALLYRLVRRKCGNVLIAIAVTFLAVAGSSIHWLARPHLFTLLFTVIFYSILERVRDGNPRLLFLLPILTVPWTNLHGGFFVGIVLVGAYAAGELAAGLVEPLEEVRRAAWTKAKRYLACAGACLLASFANPYFYHLHAHILRYITDPFHTQYVNEFWSLNFHHPVANYFEPMIVLGVVAALWNLFQKRYAYPLLLLGWMHLALMSMRNIPIYLIVAAPLAAEALQDLLRRLPEAGVARWLGRLARGVEELGAGFGATDRLTRVPLTSVMAALVLIMLFYIPSGSSKLEAEYDPQKYPAKAVEVLRADPLQAIFTDDEWGDYLIYRLYPKTKVFVDGRSDFYGARFDEQYLDVLNGKHNWEQILDRYRVETVLLRADACLASTLKQSGRWRPVYDDGVAIIFRSTTRGPQMAQGGSTGGTQVSAASGSGVLRDRVIAPPANRDPRITKTSVRREPS
jgi:hypothetical protein